MKTHTQTSVSQYESVYKYGKKIIVHKGEHIYDADRDNTIHYAHLLDHGLCALSGLTNEGETRTYLYFHARRMIGFFQMIRNIDAPQGNRPFLITAKTECVLYRLDENTFLDLLEHDGTFSRTMFSVISENYLDVLNRFRQNEEDSTSVRLFRLLLDFSDYNSEGLLQLPSFFTYNELAEYLGTHPVTVARIMKTLKEEDLIDKHGKVTLIKQPQKLKALIDSNTQIEY